jgi:hypothetical protein
MLTMWGIIDLLQFVHLWERMGLSDSQFLLEQSMLQLVLQTVLCSCLCAIIVYPILKYLLYLIF